jgi:hypothetical protein
MQAEPTATPIRISTNTIIDGKFYLRGEPLPFSRAEDLPDNLKPLVVTEPEAEEENEPCGAFELNTAYTLTSDGQLGRALRRQVAQMEAENAEEAWLNQANAAELPPEIAAALEDSHQSDVARQAAQLAATARRADDIADAAAAAAEPPTLYVKRASRHYIEIHRTKLKPGEAVYVRQPDGGFDCIGTTDGKSQLPDLPITA